ncbi:hypothetical protein DESC_600067 [Desulfosarcina cetonica]|nr:hypothetical protein DESC_600067 [Desulfosarcina cetonica]
MTHCGALVVPHHQPGAVFPCGFCRYGDPQRGLKGLSARDPMLMLAGKLLILNLEGNVVLNPMNPHEEVMYALYHHETADVSLFHAFCRHDGLGKGGMAGSRKHSTRRQATGCDCGGRQPLDLSS